MKDEWKFLLHLTNIRIKLNSIDNSIMALAVGNICIFLVLLKIAKYLSDIAQILGGG